MQQVTPQEALPAKSVRSSARKDLASHWVDTGRCVARACPNRSSRCHGSEFNGHTGAVEPGPAQSGFVRLTIAEGSDGQLYVN